MCAQSSLVTLAAVVITAFVLVTSILFGSMAARAEDAKWDTRVHPVAPPAAAIRPFVPTFRLNVRDEIAALERIQFALSEVGDGTAYVWRRWHGGLAGVIQPVSSFKHPSGKVCRNLMVLLTTSERTSKIEGVACRLASGRWQLEG